MPDQHQSPVAHEWPQRPQFFESVRSFTHPQFPAAQIVPGEQTMGAPH